MNMISFRGQKKALENRPSHTIMSRLNRIHQRADFTRQPKTKAPAPVTQERRPRGGKKSLGALTDMNSRPVSSDRGGSWKTLGYTMNVSNTTAPKRTIITHRYARMTQNAIRCLISLDVSSGLLWSLAPYTYESTAEPVAEASS